MAVFGVTMGQPPLDSSGASRGSYIAVAAGAACAAAACAAAAYWLVGGLGSVRQPTAGRRGREQYCLRQSRSRGRRTAAAASGSAHYAPTSGPQRPPTGEVSSGGDLHACSDAALCSGGASAGSSSDRWLPLVSTTAAAVSESDSASSVRTASSPQPTRDRAPPAQSLFSGSASAAAASGGSGGVPTGGRLGSAPSHAGDADLSSSLLGGASPHAAGHYPSSGSAASAGAPPPLRRPSSSTSGASFAHGSRLGGGRAAGWRGVLPAASAAAKGRTNSGTDVGSSSIGTVSGGSDDSAWAAGTAAPGSSTDTGGCVRVLFLLYTNRPAGVSVWAGCNEVQLAGRSPSRRA